MSTGQQAIIANSIENIKPPKIEDESKNTTYFDRPGAKGEISRTDAIGPVSLTGRNGNREKPGFTPNESYESGRNALLKNENTEGGHSDETWFGKLLDKHPDYSGDVGSDKYTFQNTSDKFDSSEQKGVTLPNFMDETLDPYQYLSTRDHYLLFNDSSTDYFKHGLHILHNLTPHRTDKNDRETWDGKDEGEPQRLSNFKGTPYENEDPVIFGFEIVIDNISSPLLNGSVEDFIDQFSMISEIKSKKKAIYDFKNQFVKIFKTKSPNIRQSDNTDLTASIKSPDVVTSQNQTQIFKPGKPAYLSHYLKKIGGLEFLIESNSANKKKSFVDYRNDLIKLTFNEDISLTMGTLAHLYKLLMWSKPNGKALIPDNLLRFNCDIIISEVRNMKRVRKAVDTGAIEVIKDNVSRHIYSLKECQLWFDEVTHDKEIDLSGQSNPFDQVSVTMDFKYVTSKFERWTPNPANPGFGQYIGYNSGAIWKLSNPSSTSENATDVPKFYDVNKNSLFHNGVTTPVILQNISYSQNNVASESYRDAQTPDDEGREPQKKTAFDNFKKNAKDAGKRLAKNLESSVKRELQGVINQRVALLNSTIGKVLSAVGLNSRIVPRSVYPWPVTILGGRAPYFDVRGELNEFLGGSLTNFITTKETVKTSVKNLISNPFKNPFK